MESGRIYAGSNVTVILQNDKLPSSSDVLESLWISNSSPSFHGDSLSCSTSMVNFEDIRGGENPTDRPFFPQLEKEENGKNNTEDYDSCFHQPEKKRRLAASQVQFLEKNFEVENKLEPERKVQLAKELGLQPRQVAIWFQNRRARFKTKQLEKDYDGLKASYDRLKDEYEGLVQEKERLENEVRLLTDKLLLREKECTNSEPTHPTNPTDLEPRKQIPKMENSKNKSDFPVVSFKQEEASSAKSDVFYSDSPPLEPADSSHAFGAEQSDDDELKRTVLPPLCFPKLEDECYNDPSSNGYNWNFPVEGSQLLGCGLTDIF